MSRIFTLLVASSLLIVYVEQTRGLAMGGAKRVKRQDMTSELGDYPLDDVALLQPIFRTPLKRQWCRAGMSYNPVIGSCTLSLAGFAGAKGICMGYKASIGDFTSWSESTDVVWCILLASTKTPSWVTRLCAGEDVAIEEFNRTPETRNKHAQFSSYTSFRLRHS